MQAASQKVPLTRPVSLTIHESMFEPLQRAAKDETDGSISEWIRLRIYAHLLNTGRITPQDIQRLG